MSRAASRLGFLTPLLLVQGIYTRIATPKLPEPQGLRSGSEGEGAELSLLILGDSSAAGVGADFQSQALSGNLVGQLAHDFRVKWRLFAWTGAKTQDLVRALATEAIDPADFVVLAIGVNDVTGGIALHDWLSQHDTLLKTLEDAGFGHVVISDLPPMGEFPALPKRLRNYLGKRAQTFDQARTSWAKGRDTVSIVPMDFDGVVSELVAKDGFHPGPLAYQAWGRVLAKVVSRLAKGE
ncbi:MAG: SGNH/GDSL hydrolase family protein [Pseudomonadota bacterium]